MQKQKAINEKTTQELETLKETLKDKIDLSEKEQEALDQAVLALVDVQEEPVKKKAEFSKVENTYAPEEGTENVVHAIISKSQKYNPRTGEKLEQSYLQYFTLGEWQLFKESYERLGYEIEKILYNPFN